MIDPGRSQTWVTADFHLGHRNILKYQPGRLIRWPSVEAHDQGLKDLWNAAVAPGDDVYHLGDFTLHHRVDTALAHLDDLNGRIHLVPGNHDVKLLRRLGRGILDPRVTPYGEVVELSCAGRRFRLSHHPADDWEGRDGWSGVLSLHGHAHGRRERVPDGAFDVGIDSTGFQLVRLSTLVSHLESFVEAARE